MEEIVETHIERSRNEGEAEEIYLSMSFFRCRFICWYESVFKTLCVYKLTQIKEIILMNSFPPSLHVSFFHLCSGIFQTETTYRNERTIDTACSLVLLMLLFQTSIAGMETKSDEIVSAFLSRLQIHIFRLIFSRTRNRAKACCSILFVCDFCSKHKLLSLHLANLWKHTCFDQAAINISWTLHLVIYSKPKPERCVK